MKRIEWADVLCINYEEYVQGAKIIIQKMIIHVAH